MGAAALSAWLLAAVAHGQDGQDGRDEPTRGTPITLAEALRSTLSHHPDIADARAGVDAARAGVDAARGRFDPTLTVGLGHDHDRSPLLPGELVTDTTTLGVGASAGFQSGTVVAPSFSLERRHERIRPDSTGMSPDAVHRARADLTVIQPLLRGAGRAGAASELSSARHDQRAAEHFVAYAAQARVFSTVVAYYTLVSTERDLALFEAVRSRARTLVEETTALVEAEQRPRADLRQFEGNLANQTRAAAEAEIARLTALQNLGLAMGLDPRTTGDWRTTGDFPPATPPSTDGETAVQTALALRKDMEAARARVAAAQALVAGADHNERPNLDLALSLGYAGALDDDDGVGPFFQSAGSHIAGPNASAQLTLELPVHNHARRAELMRRRAEHRRAEIARDDLEREIRGQVRIAMDELRESALAVEASERAAELFRQAIQDERDKMREGLSTVIDVVLTEDRLTAAELSLTRNRLRHAVAQARLRFAMGALPTSPADASRAAQTISRSEGAPHAGQ